MFLDNVPLAFNYIFYSDYYLDLHNYFGYDESGLKNHFLRKHTNSHIRIKSGHLTTQLKIFVHKVIKRIQAHKASVRII